jgi:hypothetical protein
MGKSCEMLEGGWGLRNTTQCHAMTSDEQGEQRLRLMGLNQRGRADTYSRSGMANKPDGRVPDSELPCNVSDLCSRSQEPT